MSASPSESGDPPDVERLAASSRPSEPEPSTEPDVQTGPSPEQELDALDAAGATRRLRNGLISLAMLIVLVVGLFLAVPGLHGVAHEVTHMSPTLVVAAILLEILSCAGYVLAFLQVFERVPIRFGARVALSELAFGSAVSLGGASSVAAGALLLVERGGNPVRVAERSAVLFLLTSAINVLTLVLAGFGLWLGLLPGSSNPLLTLVPGSVALVVFLAFMAVPVLSDRFFAGRRKRWALAIRSTAQVIRETEEILFRPDWRIIGAIGFLWFDIGVLAVCFAAVGPVPPLAVIVVAYQIGYLSNLLPVPGNIGVLDGSIIGLFALFGVSATKATSATIVYHGISLWVPAMWGTIAFLMLRRSRGEPITLRPGRRQRRRSGADLT
ncbi:MAG: lysylphosphatidylglycerol synthase transmembrane domain-containing protein [Solirubrobacteraceae bacterium]